MEFGPEIPKKRNGKTQGRAAPCAMNPTEFQKNRGRGGGKNCRIGRKMWAEKNPTSWEKKWGNKAGKEGEMGERGGERGEKRKKEQKNGRKKGKKEEKKGEKQHRYKIMEIKQN